MVSQLVERSTKLGTRLLLGKPEPKMSTIAAVLPASIPICREAWSVTYQRDAFRVRSPAVLPAR